MSAPPRDADTSQVQFHIDHPPDSREPSRTSRNAASRSQHDRPVNTPAVSSATNGGAAGPAASPRTGGGMGGAAAPGYSNDMAYGSAYTRSKVEGAGATAAATGNGGHTSNAPQPAPSFVDRMTAGLTRPTNLSAGERPYAGVGSEAVEGIWDHNDYSKVEQLPDTTSTGSWWPYWANMPAMWFPWNVNANAYRLGMMVVVAICIMGTDRRNQRWMHYLTLALTVDYGLRMLFGPRCSLVTLTGELLHWFFSLCKSRSAPRGLFPESMVAGAPYQFHDAIICLLLTAATICFFANGRDADKDIAGAVLLAVVALIEFIHLLFGLPIFVWLWNWMIRKEYLWKDSELKAAIMRDEAQKLAVSEELRLNAARGQLKDPSSAPQQIHYAGASSSSGRRALPYTYRAANEYHKRHDWNPIKNMKVSYFLGSCTLVALAWVWAEASRAYVYPLSNLPWYILVIAAVVLFGLHLLLWLSKLVLYPRHVEWEWDHPIYRSLFVLIPLNWILFCPLIVHAGYRTFAEVIFWIGGPLLLFLSIVIIALWLHELHSWDNFNSSWFALPLANAVAACILVYVHPNYRESAWLWLGFSTFFWLILSTWIFFKNTFSLRWYETHRYHLWMLMGACMAIAFAAAVIHSPLLTDEQGGQVTRTTINTSNAGPTAGLSLNSAFEVVQGQSGNDIFLPNSGTNNEIDFLSENLSWRLVPVSGQSINELAVGNAWSVPATANGARCSSKTDGSGWNCVLDSSAEGATTQPRLSPWNIFAIAMFYTGLVLFLILLVLSLFGYFGRSHWNLHYWSVGLSMCMLTLATLLYHADWHSATTRGVSTTAMVLTNIVVALLFANHLLALITGQLYRPDHLMLSPLEFFRLSNKALREALFAMQAHLNNPTASVDDWRYFEHSLLPRFILAASTLAFVKRGALYPVLTAWFGTKLWQPLDENYMALEQSLERIIESMRLSQQMDVNSPQRAEAEAVVRSEFATYVSGLSANMDEEESHLFPLARRYIGHAEARGMVRKSWEEVSPAKWASVIPFVVEFLHDDRQRVRYVMCLSQASPMHAQLLGKFLYEHLDPFMYERLVVDMPEIRPRLTPGYARVW